MEGARCEHEGEPGRVVRGSGQVQDTVAGQRFAGEPLRKTFSGSFSRQENGPKVEVRKSGVEDRQGEEEERKGGTGAAVADEKGKGEGDSLDDRLPFMLASLKRVALTVHDLQGRCARLSHGKI